MLKNNWVCVGGALININNITYIKMEKLGNSQVYFNDGREEDCLRLGEPETEYLLSIIGGICGKKFE